MFRPLDDGGFIWASERSGFNHLYLYDSGGNLVRQLTSGDWQVDSVAGVDQKTRRHLLHRIEGRPNREVPVQGVHRRRRDRKTDP